MTLPGSWARETESDVDMSIHRLSRRGAAWLVGALLLAGLIVAPGEAARAQGSEPAAFTVRDMRVEGLQRISEGTV